MCLTPSQSIDKKMGLSCGFRQTIALRAFQHKLDGVVKRDAVTDRDKDGAHVILGAQGNPDRFFSVDERRITSGSR